MRLKSTIYESTRAPLTRSPFPDGEGLEVRRSASIFYKGAMPEGGKQSPVTQNHSSLLSNYGGNRFKRF